MIKKDVLISSPHHDKPIVMDYRYNPNQLAKPIVLFIHGFKGFKDAMHFNVIAEAMANTGFIFAKINLSHNGTTPDQPLEFADLDAFGENNFGIELDDIGVALDYLCSNDLDIPEGELDRNQLFIIGHSRGGSVSLLKACEDSRIKKVVTWAAVPDLGSFWPKSFVKEWKNKGIQYIENKRTLQQMPMRYQMVEDYQENEARYDISSNLEQLQTPFLAIHGTDDETIPASALKKFKTINPSTNTHHIADATHTFGGKHPWEGELPAHSKSLIEITANFLLN